MDEYVEFNPSCPEISPSPDPATPDNEFCEIAPPERNDRDNAARAARRKLRLGKGLLLQAASAFLAIVLLTSSVGVDILGEELSGSTLMRVLSAAGAGHGVVTISMLWQTSDDIDLHVITPTGNEIYYGNREADGGYLDVDMQVSSIVEEPVENIFFETALPGRYRVFIVNYSDRNPGPADVLVRVTVRGRAKDYHVKLDQYFLDICEFNY